MVGPCPQGSSGCDLLAGENFATAIWYMALSIYIYPSLIYLEHGVRSSDFFFCVCGFSWRIKNWNTCE